MAVPPIDWLDGNLPGWRTAFLIVAGLATTGFSVWITAKFTVRSTVRQSVWKQVYEKKLLLFEQFQAQAANFGQVLGDVIHLQKAWNLPMERSVAQVYHMATERSEKPSTPGEVKFTREIIQLLEKHRLGKDAEKNEITKKSVFAMMRNQCFYDMLLAISQLTQSRRNLSLVMFDPQQAKDLSSKAVEISNKLAHESLPMKTDFNQEREAWLEIENRTAVFMRKDLEKSCKSLKHAVRHSKKWEAKYIKS